MPPATKEMTSPSRRVVKAKAPPPSLDLPKPASEEEEDVEVIKITYALGSPSVERELEQEQVEKWRKERLVGMAAKQKQERDKEVLERRQSTSTPTRGMDNAGNAEATTIPPEILQEFSVEPKHPEHKRSGDTISGISEGEPLGKRRKQSMDEVHEKEENASTVSKMIVVSAIVAAVAVGVAIFRRSRG